MSKTSSCWVRPGVCDVRASVLRAASAFTRPDLPTLERPATASSTLDIGGRLSRAFPAGLVIYWAWNNLLSIIQQFFIMRRHGVKVELWDNLRGIFARKAPAKG